MIINAENLVLGRMAAVVAKQALLGEDINIVNCEKAVITGDKVSNYEKYKECNQKMSPYRLTYGQV